MILKFAVNIVYADGLAFLLVGTWPITSFWFLLKFRYFFFCVLVMPQGAFGKKWAEGGGQMGPWRGQKIWILGGGTRKKSREKNGVGVERKKMGGGRGVEPGG